VKELLKLSREEEERARRLHYEAFYVDTHCDTILSWMPPPELPVIIRKTLKGYRRRGFTERSGEGHLDLPRMLEGGVDCQVFAVYVAPVYHSSPLRQALRMIDAFYSELGKTDRAVPCTSYSEVMNALRGGRVAALLSIEGGEPLEGDLGVLRMLYRLGVRILTITHNRRNRLGNGCGEKGSKGGLSTFGVEVVREMNRLGMLVDVSHLNEPGFWDVIETSQDPVIASHSNARALCDHVRNLTDEQIMALAERGGVVGVTFVRSFLRKDPENASVNDVLDHIDHIVELVGVDHVGIGSDYDGIDQAPIGLEDVTKVLNITRGLVARGYSDGEIRKILGENFLRVFRRVLG